MQGVVVACFVPSVIGTKPYVFGFIVADVAPAWRFDQKPVIVA